MRYLTDKQKTYIENIIPKRNHKHKQDITSHGKEIPIDTFIEEKIKYLKNCIFWINEYNEGRESKEKLSYTIKAIERHCAEIRNKLLNN